MKPTPLLAGVLLGLLGFAGNWCKYELFFDLDFLFGTFFVILALRRFGTEAGILAGLIASTATFFLWQNFWPVIAFSTEILVVAWLYAKHRIDPTSAMILYWLLPGPFLVWLFAHQILAVPLATTVLIVLTRAVNSILLALLATSVLLAISLCRPREDQGPGYREFLSTFMLAIVLFPALIAIMSEIRGEMAEHLEEAGRHCSNTSKLARRVIDSWLSDNPRNPEAWTLFSSHSQQGSPADLSRLNELLRDIVGSRDLVITILDGQGAVVTSTDPRGRIMKSWPHSEGEFRPVSAEVSHWIPRAEAGATVRPRWLRSCYFSEARVSPGTAWTVMVEAPLLPALTEMTRTTNRLFGGMAGLVLLVSGLAFFLSRWQSLPLVRLQELTERVARHPEQAVEGPWPKSPIREIDALSRNFRRMADSQRHTVAELFTLNHALEKMIILRTSEFRKSEERLRLAMAAARQGWFDLDIRTGATTVSPEYARMAGHAQKEFVVSMEGWIENIHPEDRAGALEAFRHCLESGETTTMEYRRRYNNSEGWLWLSSTGKVVEYDSEHRPLRMIGIHADISERKHAEEALRELNRTLEARVEAETIARLEKERMLIQQAKMAAMGEMIGAIAHQWRQPLNAVAVIAQDIGEAFEAGSLDREYLRQAVDSAMAQVLFMSKTIDDFRDFFRPDKAKKTFDAKKAMARVLKMMAGQYRSHNLGCSITCLVHGKTFEIGEPVETCKEMRINGFENELQQVFLNLLDNAKDAILERRRRNAGAPEKGRILVTFDREQERVVIRITDNGAGIPAAILDRIFEPYFTTKEPGMGTGIGLYMAKMIVENNMGGRIAARNSEEGAEFTIVI